MKHKPLVLLAIAVVILVLLLSQSKVDVTFSDATFTSPLPTPPGPTPPPPSGEAQQALEYVARREGIPVEGLQVVYDREQTFPLTNRTFRAVTVLDIRTVEGQAYHVLVDLADGRIVEDREAVKAAEAAAYQARYGEFHPSLHARLQEASDDELLPIAVWMAFDDRVRTQAEVHAELAARWPEAAQSMEREGVPWAVEDAALAQEIRQEYRRMRAEDTAVRVGPLVQDLNRRGYEARTYGAMPSVTARLSKRDIVELARREDVGLVYLIEEQGAPLIDAAVPTNRVPAVWQRGFDGSDIRIAILEQNDIYADPYCLNVVARRLPVTQFNQNYHKSLVASAAACSNGTYTGVAPGAQIVDAGFVFDSWGGSQEDVVEALLWAVQQQNADVVNISYRWEYDSNMNWTDRAFDYWAREEFVTIVSAAGNGGPGADDQDWMLASPTKAWNVISVGASDDGQTPNRGDDGMWSDSSFRRPNSDDGDREKPEVAAPGVGMQMMDPNGQLSPTDSGTSYAAPQVAGLAVLLIDRHALLAGWPEAIKAIIMASAVHNVHGPSDIPTGAEPSLRDGAGSIDAALADSIAQYREFGDTCDTPCWWGEYTYNYSPPVGGSIYRYFYASRGEQIRVAISWWSNAEEPWSYPILGHDDLDTNYDLFVYSPTPSDDLVGYTASFDNNYELAEFVAPETGLYAIRVYRSPSDDQGEDGNWLGIAWAKDATYLPDIRSSYEGWDSEILARNEDARARDVTASLFSSSGSVAGEVTHLNLPPNKVWVHNPSHSNFRGSAIVDGGEDVSVMVRTLSGSESLAYGGMPSQSDLGFAVGTTLYFPSYLQNYYGWTSYMDVTNVGTGPTTVDVRYYNDTGSGAGRYDDVYLGPNESHRFPSSVATAQIGGVRVVADKNNPQPLAAVMTYQHPAEGSFALAALSKGAWESYAPSVFRSYWGWECAVEVFNINPNSTSVTVQFYGPDGGLVKQEGPFTLNRYGHKELYLPSLTNPPLPTPNWRGGVVVSADRHVVTSVHQANYDGHDSEGYRGFSSGASPIHLPWLQQGGNPWWGSLSVMNTGCPTTTTTVHFYDANGTQVGSTNKGLARYASFEFYVEIPSSTRSAVVTTSPSCPVVATVNQAWYDIADSAASYSGID